MRLFFRNGFRILLHFHISDEHAERPRHDDGSGTHDESGMIKIWTFQLFAKVLLCHIFCPLKSSRVRQNFCILLHSWKIQVYDVQSGPGVPYT